MDSARKRPCRRLLSTRPSWLRWSETWPVNWSALPDTMDHNLLHPEARARSFKMLRGLELVVAASFFGLLTPVSCVLADECSIGELRCASYGAEQCMHDCSDFGCHNHWPAALRDGDCRQCKCIQLPSGHPTCVESTDPDPKCSGRSSYCKSDGALAACSEGYRTNTTPSARIALRCPAMSKYACRAMHSRAPLGFASGSGNSSDHRRGRFFVVRGFLSPRPPPPLAIGAPVHARLCSVAWEPRKRSPSGWGSLSRFSALSAPSGSSRTAGSPTVRTAARYRQAATSTFHCPD